MRIKHNIGALKVKLVKAKKDLRTLGAAVKQAAQIVRKEILKDTGASKDINGRKFKKYSAGYAAKKGNAKVNLKDSGKMLSSLRVKRISNTKYELSFSSKKEGIKAAVHNRGIGKMPKRQFFGLSKKAKAKIGKSIKAKLKRRFR